MDFRCEKACEYATEKVERDFEQGWQGIEYKLNSVGSSRGDYPFVTMTIGLATSKFGKMAAITLLNVHKEGQGKNGFKSCRCDLFCGICRYAGSTVKRALQFFKPCHDIQGFLTYPELF